MCQRGALKSGTNRNIIIAKNLASAITADTLNQAGNDTDKIIAGAVSDNFYKIKFFSIDKSLDRFSCSSLKRASTPCANIQLTDA